MSQLNNAPPAHSPTVDSGHRTERAPSASRRTQHERTRDAKERLMSAAVEVLLKVGYNGLTTKEVARVAGLSNGALMHHYASKAELVVAATARVYDECLLRGQRVAHTDDALRRPVEGFITDCLSVYFDWPFLAALEILVIARTDEQLMAQMLPVMEHYRTSCDVVWMKVFTASGMTAAKARLILNLTLNLVRGMAVNRLWRHDDDHYRKYLRDWVRLVERDVAAAVR